MCDFSGLVVLGGRDDKRRLDGAHHFWMVVQLPLQQVQLGLPELKNNVHMLSVKKRKLWDKQLYCKIPVRG